MLDAHTRAELTRMTPGDQAERQYEEEPALYRSPREWWRVVLADVVPAHRGKGLVGELLAEGTRILAGNDVPRIRAGIDVTIEHQVDLVWGHGM